MIVKFNLSDFLTISPILYPLCDEWINKLMIWAFSFRLGSRIDQEMEKKSVYEKCCCCRPDSRLFSPHTISIDTPAYLHVAKGKKSGEPQIRDRNFHRHRRSPYTGQHERALLKKPAQIRQISPAGHALTTVLQKREASCDSWWQFFYRTLHLSRAPHTPRHAISLCRVCSLCSENVVDLLLCPRPNAAQLTRQPRLELYLLAERHKKETTQRISFNIDIMPAQRRSPHCVGRNSIFQNFTLHFFPHCRLSTLDPRRCLAISPSPCSQHRLITLHHKKIDFSNDVHKM